MRESEYNESMFDVKEISRERDEVAKTTTHIPGTLEPVWWLVAPLHFYMRG